MKSLHEFFANKPIEFWLILAGMTLYVIARDAEREPVRLRLIKTAASILLTIGLAGDLALRFPFLGEVGAAVMIMALGLFVLDMATALIQDRDFIKEVIRKRFGGK